MNPVEVVALDALDLLVVVDNESDTLSSVDIGNPKGGTPLMVASPSIAIDLPMKLLIWEDVKGSVWISYNAPSYLAAWHGLAPELSPVLSAVESLASTAGHENR